LLFRTPTGLAVEARMLREGETVHAPALIDLEVAQVLRRYVGRGDIAEPRARVSIDLLVRFPMERYSHEPLLPRIWALRGNMTAYDAAYVALAEGLRAPLVTCDAKLAAAPGVRAPVELIS
jgi:predicted nucleic acid-binding protein